MSEFDKGLVKGDLVTGYHKGFHKVTRVERRFRTKEDEKRNYGKEGEEYSSLIHYKTVLNASHGVSKGTKEKACDSAYCEKVTRDAVEADRNKAINAANKGADVLLGLLGERCPSLSIL